MQPTSVAAGQEDRRWFLATLVVEISVQSESRNVVHRNLFLISAHSPEEAYSKAIGLGHQGEVMYENPAGSAVRHTFRGISQLDELVDDEPVDGAELAFEQRTGVSEEDIQALILPKDQLHVFNPPAPGRTDVPDYSSREVLVTVLEEISEGARHTGERE